VKIAKRRGTGMNEVYLPCFARLLCDIRGRLDTVRKKEPLYVDMRSTVENRVDFRCLEMVWAKGFGGLKVGE
jgi:hypothetical protein